MQKFKLLKRLPYRWPTMFPLGKMRKDGPTTTTPMDTISRTCFVNFPDTSDIQCPEYIAKLVSENEEQVYQVYIYLSPHLDRAHVLQETFPTLRETYEVAALEALTELCERHSGDLDVAPASYLPIHYQADGHWRVRHQRMIEDQREMDDFPARYGRDVTGGQLATTAEYALNIFNLQQC